MALTKKIDFGNGVVTDGAYIEVSSINLDFTNKIANFVVKTYLNKSVKDEGLGTIIPDEHFNIGNSMFYPAILPSEISGTTESPVDLFNKYFLTGDARINAETYLKTLDKYKDATSI